MDIDYEIKIHTFWHCGSGLSRGADTDALVVKDKNNLPYVPGKTVKGLLREAVEDYLTLTGLDEEKVKLFETLFGKPGQRSDVFFGNAVLAENEQSWIVKSDTSEYMYRNVTSTAVGDKGVAKEHSLRSMEVTMPCVLTGEIIGVPDGATELLQNAAGLIKCLGANRNHGLGRCTFIIKKGGKR